MTTAHPPIKIIQGFEPSSYFWFSPVTFREEADGDCDLSAVLTDDTLSIEEDDVFDYLRPFLEKYFDEDLPCNRDRGSSHGETMHGFESYLVHNFYTYETVRAMLRELAEKAAASTLPPPSAQKQPPRRRTAAALKQPAAPTARLRRTWSRTSTEGSAK